MKTIKTTYGTMDIYNELESSHTSVTIKRERFPSNPNRETIELYVQSIDAYRYQRELIIRHGHIPGDSNTWEWRVIAYRHPGYRHETVITEKVALRLLAYFLDLVAKYTSLLFNVGDDRRARNEGFVHFHDRLLLGEFPSENMLK